MPGNNHKILVHTCCAACTSYLVMELEKDDFDIALLFFNPDDFKFKPELIAGVRNLAEKKKLNLIVPKQEELRFKSIVAPLADSSSIKFINDKERFLRKKRDILISLILERALLEAKKIGYSNVTTAMLCSPYRDHNNIWDTGTKIAENNQIDFYYKDFRKGYWMGRNIARNNGFYIPEYCSDYLTEQS